MTGTLTTGNRAIMTAKTGTDDFSMVHRSRGNRGPARREFKMTGIAKIAGRDMIGILTACRYTIVASDTVTDKRRMINCCGRCPGIGAMTGITFQCRHHMSARLALRQ